MINRMISFDPEFVAYKLVKYANLDMDIESTNIISVTKTSPWRSTYNIVDQA